MKMQEKKNEKNYNTVIKVSFHEPVGGKTDYYFGSLKAIYTEFSAEQIGCKLVALYGAGISLDKRKVTDKCIISKHAVVRAPQKREND